MYKGLDDLIEMLGFDAGDEEQFRVDLFMIINKLKLDAQIEAALHIHKDLRNYGSIADNTDYVFKNYLEQLGSQLRVLDGEEVENLSSEHKTPQGEN